MPFRPLPPVPDIPIGAIAQAAAQFLAIGMTGDQAARSTRFINTETTSAIDELARMDPAAVLELVRQHEPAWRILAPYESRLEAWIGAFLKEWKS